MKTGVDDLSFDKKFPKFILNSHVKFKEVMVMKEKKVKKEKECNKLLNKK